MVLGVGVGNIFINYRRDDEAGFVHALYGQLEKTFPTDRLFMDVDSIPYGKDFVEVLDESVSQCKVLLAVIGKDWLGPINEQGQDTRLSDPNDFVRLEIASALTRNITVIPVLVNKAEIPPESVLPDDLKPLTRRNAIRISHDRFRSDAERLTNTLQDILSKESAAKPETEKPKKQSSWFMSPMVLVVAALAFLGLSSAIYFLTKPDQYQLTKTEKNKDAQNIAVSKDTKTFAIMGYRMQVWHSEIERMIPPIRETHTDLPRLVSFSPDSQFILTGGCKTYKNNCLRGEAKLWDIKSDSPLHTVLAFNAEVTAVAFSSDGNSFFVSGCKAFDETKNRCATYSLEQRETSSGILLKQIHLNDEVKTIAVHPNGKALFVGGYQSSIKQIDLATGKVTSKFTQANMEGTYSLAISSDGNTLVSGGSDKKLRIWDMQHADPRLTLEGHQGLIHSVDISPDGTKILSASKDRTVRVWDARSGKLRQKIEGFDQNTIYAAFINDGDKFVSVEIFLGFKIWSVNH